TAAVNSMPAEIADINFDFIDHKDEVPSIPEMDFSVSQQNETVVIPDSAAEEPLPDLDLSDAAIKRSTVIGETVEVDTVADDAIAAEALTEDTGYTVNAEMATKLDLAMAYQEIGDKEGARELLEEVLKGGNP